MRLDHGNDNLTAHCTIHDRSQFEVQFNYDVAADNLSAGQAVEHYRIEAFYFFPSNMGITPLSFPRESFYRSLYAYIRFKTPEIPELTLLDPLSRRSPLNALSFHLKQLDMGDASVEDKAVNEARLFGCIVSSLLRARARDLDEQMQAAKARPGDAAAWRELEGSLGDFLSEVPELMGRYRSLLAEYRTLESRLAPTTLARLGHVDEFLTYRVDHTLSELHFQLQGTWEAPTRLAKVSDRLHAVAEQEAEHRARQGYISLAPGDDDALALYTYRSGALKKLIDQVLYLDVKTIQETARWKNFAAMVGAAVAAVWASLTNTGALLYVNSANIMLTMVLFALAYVAKDRIKEILRESIWTKISRYFPDNKLLIHDPTSDIDVGKCKERVTYLTKASVPADVLKVRNTQHVVDLDQERKETVILYQNDLKLYAREILSEHKRRTDIKHILRFSVEDLLARLDNPTARVQFYDPASRIFCRVRAPKVYHLNVVFRVSHWDERNRREAPYYHRIRVILDKNGIHRIDTVPLDGTVTSTQRKAQGSLPTALEENLF
jgi:hypothetical protein